VGKRLPRVTVPDFDYSARPTQKLEVPRGERIAAIRAKKAEDRARAAAKAERRSSGGAGQSGSRSGQASKPARPAVPGTNRPKAGSSPRRPGGNRGRAH
jgi:ATP-dependent RNA helicase RhlE